MSGISLMRFDHPIWLHKHPIYSLLFLNSSGDNLSYANILYLDMQLITIAGNPDYNRN